jgi:hypothetical protein
MSRHWVHTVPYGDWWKNEIEGVGVLATYETKDEAVRAGREEARWRESEHLIHNADGAIGERHSYGNDPPDVPG